MAASPIWRSLAFAFAVVVLFPLAAVGQSVDLSTSISDSPDPLTLGQSNIAYSVSFYNNSGTTATNVTLTFNAPATSTLGTYSANFSGSCSSAGQTVTCTWSSVAAYNSRTLSVQVTPTAGGTLTATSSVTSTETDSNSANNNASANTTVNAEIDVQVSSISDTPDPITLGTGDVSYTVTIYNTSSSKATNAFVNITIPAGATLVSATPNFSGTCGSGSTFTCNWAGDLNAYNTRTVTVVITPASGGTATLSATTGADQGDPDTADNTDTENTTVNAQIDLKVSSVYDTPDPITLGTGNITYTVTIYNESSSKATNPFLNVTIPAASTFVSATPNSGGTCGTGSSFTCNWSGDLNAYNTRTVTVVVTPTSGGTATLSATVGGDQSDPDASDNSVSANTTVNAEIDLQVASIYDSPDPITLGTGNITYTATIYNTSSSKATNAFVNITIPAGATFVSATPNFSGTCGSGATFTCNWSGDFNSYNTRTVTVVVTPTTGGTATLSATAGSDQPDPDNADDTLTQSTTVNAQIDMKVSSIYDTPDPMTLGTGNVSYTVTIYNESSSKATNPFVNITIPAGSTFVSATPSSSGTCGSGASFTCNWSGDINAYNTRQIVVVVTPTAGGTATLTATVGADQGDPDGTDNTLSQNTTVNAQIDVKVSNIYDSIDPITLGTGNVTYTISLYNESSSKATNPFVNVTIPAASTLVSATASSGGSCGSGASFTCNWTGDFNAYNSRTVTVTVTPTAGGTATLSATAGADQGDPDNTDNTQTEDTTVNAQIDMQVSSISDSIDPITLGTGNVTYTIWTYNQSTSKATNPLVNITLPASATFVSATASSSGTCGAPAGGVVTCNWSGDLNAFNSRSVTVVVTPTAGGTMTLSATVGADQPDPDNSDDTLAQNTTVNDQIDVQLTVSDFPDPRTLASGNVTYTVNLYNASTSKATNPVVAFTLPAGVTFVSATPNLSGTCTAPSGGVFTCSWPGDFNAFNGRSVSVVITPNAVGQLSATASVTADQTDPNTANNSETETTNINPGSAPSIGGFTPASGPIGTTVSITGSNFFSTSNVKFNFTNASFTVNNDGSITATVPSGASTGPIAITNSVGTTTSGSNFTITPAPDLAMSKTASVATTAGNTAFDYFLTVSNGGAGAANDLTVTDTLPAGVTLNSATGTNWTCSGTSTVTCTHGSLGSLATAPVITLNVTAPGSATTLTNTATVSSTTPDANSGDNSGSVAVSVTGCPTTPPITAPASVCASSSGHSASTPSVPGATNYIWSITNGTITGGQGTNAITFDASAAGPITLGLDVTSGCATVSNSVNVSVSTPAATITPSGPTTFCTGGSVTLTANSGSAWLWSNGATTQSIAVNASGTFTVDVTNVDGCTATSAPQTVTVNPLPATPTITPSGPTSFCTGGSVTLTASGGASWLWSTGATSQSINVTTSDSYSVTVTDANGCSATSAPTVVTVNPQPPAPAITPSGPTTFCDGGSVTLTASGTGTWLWSNGATTQSINVTSSGTFTVTLTDDNSCSATSAPVTVTVNPAPATPTITASGPTTFCTGDSVTLTSSPGDAWLWSNGATTQSIVVSNAGAYSVQVTNADGCSATSAPTTVSVTSASVTITGPASSCVSAPVMLDAGPGFAQYAWSTGATTQQITVSPATTTAYSVTVTDTNGCTATDSHTVNVTPNPTATISAPASVCENAPGYAASVPAQPGATYAWTIANGTITSAANGDAVTFTAGSSGSVALDVTVTNASCVSTGNVAIPIDSYPSVTISGPPEVCPSSTFTLSVPATFASYTWSTGHTGPIATISQSNPTETYSVIVTNAAGCATTATHTVTLTAPADATISAPPAVCESSAGHNASVPAQAGASYTWTIANGTITSATNTNAITFTAGASGNVTLDVTVTNGSCVAAGNVAVPITAQPSASISAPASAFHGASGTASVPAQAGATYAWSMTNGTIDSGQGTSSITFTTGASGASTALAVDVTVAGCTKNGTATIALSEAPPPCATTPPSLVSPANGASVASPVFFDWLSVPGATSYELWVDGSFSASVSTTSVTKSLPAGAHSWFVRAKLGSACSPLTSVTRTLTVAQPPTCAANGTPQITTPASGATLESPVLIQWTAAAQAIGYRVLLSVNGGPVEEAGTTNGATSLLVNLSPGSIVAFVDALFSGCPATRSNGVAFRVPAPDPCAVRTHATPVSPANGAVVLSSLVEFSWLPANSAERYRLWASLDGAPFAAVGETAETTFRATLARGAVSWFVESLYPGCASVESPMFHFTIPPAPSCGTALPELVSPAHGVVVSDGNVTFDWDPVPDAMGYELWLSLADGTPALIGTTTTETSLTHSVPAGALEWFVRALIDRCPPRDSQRARFTFTPPSTCAEHQRPILIEPLDDVRASAPLAFDWSAPAEATSYELFTIRGNAPPVRVAESVANHVGGVNLPAGPMRWFVRAHFGAGCSPLDSAEHDLELVPAPPACSTLPAPVIAAPGQISGGTQLRVQWSPVPGASAYQLEIAGNPAFTDAQTVSTTATQHPIVGSAGTTLHVRVRALDLHCETTNVSAFSAPARIFILPPASPIGSTPLADPAPLTFTYVLGAEYAGQSFTALSKQPWLSVTPSSGVVAADGTTLTIVAGTNGLPVGTTLGAVSITLNASAGRGVAANDATVLSTSFSISLVTPVTPTTKTTPPPDALIIPAVAHADGINSHFQSDVRVSNTSPRLITYQLTFTPSGNSGITQGQQSTFSIEPGRTVALDDVLKGWFGTGTGSAIGTLEIRPLTETATSTQGNPFTGLANLTSFASSRTFNVTSKGTFGQYIPAIPFANFIGSQRVLSLQQIAQSSRYRTNLGLVEGSGEPASLLVRMFGANGQQLGQFPVSLNGGQHLQLNSFLHDQGISDLIDGRVEVEVVSEGGKITAYASVLDNETSDPLLVTPVAIDSEGATKWVVPGVADLASGYANWQTDMRLFNAGAEDVEATLLFYSQSGGEPKTASVTIPAGQVRQFDKALSSIFGAANDGGAVHITTSAAARLIATARTYNLTSQGTYGQFISAVTPGEAAGAGSRPLQLLQVEESDRFRSNIGLVEVTGQPVRLEIAVVPPDAKFTAVTELILNGNEFRQIGSLLASMGLDDTHNARVTVRVVEGEGRVTAYASVIDMLTNDPTYVPAQ